MFNTIKSALQGIVQGLGRLKGYLGARMEERTTWAAIGVGITGAAALQSPWSYLFLLVAVVGALVPSTAKNGEPE